MSFDDFLVNPILAGIASVLGIISFFGGLIVAITKFRVWLLQNPNTKWLVKIPWASILVVIGITMGTGLGVRNQDVHLGLSVASSVTVVGVGIQLLQNSLLLSRTRDTYYKLTDSYKNLLNAIERLHNTEFTLSDWNISHTIYENGAGVLNEELTIVPVSEPVHYYFIWCRFARNSDPKEIKFSAVNISDKTPLDFYEVAITDNSIKYMVILDPPSIPNAPKRIAISCVCVGVWSDLVENGQSADYFHVKYRTDSVKIELIAPHTTKWKALHPAPITGNSKIEMTGDISRAVWEIANPSIKKYNYRVFLDGKKLRRVL
ncbi:MAG TPA: hypothetical protein PKK96_06375 [Anaerolineales bacterium]|nr:hypothetical protein [Anaerolineales bacterium]HNQ94250.1 hypothetical protein [Anaerolineales bacterium]HNS60612.1 hypothetical protein [Anaerolineales bacterium]